jgi:peptide-methionine (R)-S-oxide reductase
MKIFAVLFAGVVALAVYLQAQEPGGEGMVVAKEAPKVISKEEAAKMTEEDWKKKLTPEQYAIMRKAGTERPNGKVYKEFKAQGGGTYYCAGCGAELFSSKEKFDSHCGWPSFYDPSKAKNVETRVDKSHFMVRTEVVCAVCKSHLGHVFSGERFEAFDGGQTPTGQRYCINGTALVFVPFGEKKPDFKKKEAVKDETAKPSK